MEPNTEIAFYNFTITALLVGVPKLIKKVYEAGHRLLVICSSEEEMIALDKALWTFSQRDFIPHCLTQEENYLPHINPVVFSTDAQVNANNADVILNLAGIAVPGNFKKHLYAFYGSLKEHENMFKQYNAQKSINQPTFWKQTSDGKWLQEQ